MMLSDALRSERGMDDVDAAIASFEMLRDAASRPLGNIARRLDLLGEAIHSNDATAIREGVSYAVEMASIPRPEDRLRGEFADWVRKAEASGAGVRILDVAFADTHRLFPANHMSRLTAESRETLEYYSSRLPFAVRRDTAAPTASVVQYMKAVDRVLDVVARELDLPKNSLLPDQKTVPLRFSYSAVSADDSSEGNVMTLQSKETADDIDARVAMVINVSVTRGRTFLHELGHVIDAGNKLSIGSESRDNILLTSGILAAAQESVGRLYPEGGDFADYLLSNSEVFARSFEAHICNVMMRDGVFEEAGGLLISHGYDVAAPFGDLELSERFMASLRAEIGARKDAAYDQDVAKRAERDVEPPAYSTDYSAGP